jgi:hypothetical protein
MVRWIKMKEEDRKYKKESKESKDQEEIDKKKKEEWFKKEKNTIIEQRKEYVNYLKGLMRKKGFNPNLRNDKSSGGIKGKG